MIHAAIVIVLGIVTIWCGVKTFKDDKPTRKLNP